MTYSQSKNHHERMLARITKTYYFINRKMMVNILIFDIETIPFSYKPYSFSEFILSKYANSS